MTTSVHRQILAGIGSHQPERGMLLGGSRADGVIRHVLLDDQAERSSVTYAPDQPRINRTLHEWWNPSGISLLGFAHSHPAGLARPSRQDVEYAAAILAANRGLGRLLLPIVTVDPPAIHPYVVARAGRGVQVRRTTMELADEVLTPIQESRSPVPNPRRLREEMFRRVREAYDLPLLTHSRLVVVGCGGSAEWIRDCARAGVHEFVLIDPDVVSESNLATQHVSREHLARPKVEVLREEILDLNPLCSVTARAVRLDELADADIESLLGICDERPPVRTVLCAMTDDFPAQARVNRLALQFGVPSIAAQLYARGEGAEVSFTLPGVTPACHRCMLRTRYEAYADPKFRSSTTSDGSPIFSTTWTNAVKGEVTMALLHHGTDHPRWGGMLRRVANRNLVQIRMHPDANLPAFLRTLGSDAEPIFMGESLWLPQRPQDDSGGSCCPDCGGTGDLRAAVGTFADTRVMR